MAGESAILKRHVRNLLSRRNVVGCGVGYKWIGGRRTSRLAISVLVRQKVPLDTLPNRDQIPPQIDGVDTDVLEVGDLQLLVDRQARVRPAPPGVSVGNFRISAGTLGAVVRDRDSGDLMILSNNHVLANTTDGRDERAAENDPILQPGSLDGGTTDNDVIAHLTRFVPLRRLQEQPTCGIAQATQRAANAVLRRLLPQYTLQLLRTREAGNVVDAAVARVVAPDEVTPEILGIGWVTGVAAPVVGQQVQISGRTSGVADGEIVAIDVTTNVGMGGGETAQFRDQILTSRLAQPGDSGSLLLDGERRAVGLLFAGSQTNSLCNRIDHVLDSLQVDMVTD